MHKLAAGQGDIALGFDTEMNSLIAGHQDIEDKVETLPAKFVDAVEDIR